MLSVTNDLASRLHQAIILSSEQHATDGHCTTLHRTSKLFLFSLQNIVNASCAAKNENRCRRIDYLANNVGSVGV
jgi:hypothetical protein